MRPILSGLGELDMIVRETKRCARIVKADPHTTRYQKIEELRWLFATRMQALRLQFSLRRSFGQPCSCRHRDT